jgi:NAD(P)-dependent dehydrogenase (short-subunit alcohol dehydrogenase family)
MNLKQKNGVALITGGSTGIGATRADGPAQEREGTTIMRSVLIALNQGKISEAVHQFDERFTLTDHALDLKHGIKRADREDRTDCRRVILGAGGGACVAAPPHTSRSLMEHFIDSLDTATSR